jgi:hypothetical protein
MLNCLSSIRKLSERERVREKKVAQASKGGIALASSDPQGYNECYPDLTEMYDAIDDSDDEADFSKMDLGNKKGPVGRWDFDTAEEYADYMSNKEALPKAAFQYGLKMAAGMHVNLCSFGTCSDVIFLQAVKQEARSVPRPIRPSWTENGTRFRRLLRRGRHPMVGDHPKEQKLNKKLPVMSKQGLMNS